MKRHVRGMDDLENSPSLESARVYIYTNGSSRFDDAWCVNVCQPSAIKPLRQQLRQLVDTETPIPEREVDMTFDVGGISQIYESCRGTGADHVLMSTASRGWRLPLQGSLLASPIDGMAAATSLIFLRHCIPARTEPQDVRSAHERPPIPCSTSLKYLLFSAET